MVAKHSISLSGLITIDGYRTAEFDFGRMHPTMLYADEGLTLEDDAYDIGIGKGDEFRDVVKQLFNAMVQMKEPKDNHQGLNSATLVKLGSNFEN